MDFEALARHGTIDAQDLKLFEFVDEPQTAFARLRSRMPAPPAEPVRGVREVTLPRASLMAQRTRTEGSMLDVHANMPPSRLAGERMLARNAI